MEIKDFHSPQPDGFALKTSLEINLLANKLSFENNIPVEIKRPIGYGPDNTAKVSVIISINDANLSEFFEISKLFPLK